MQKVTDIPHILPILALTIVFGCGKSTDTTPAKAAPITLRVAAASDLQPWLGPALEEWGLKRSPQVKVETIYGASLQLAAQIRAGAPVDLFLAADKDSVESLVSIQRIDPGSVRPYAVGSLAVLSHESIGVRSIDDLDRAKFRHLAIASPETAPYGKAAKAALISKGLWEKLEPKIVVAASVRQAFQQVRDGNAEVGIVSLSHARNAVEDHPGLISNIVPQELHPPIMQYLGIVRSADASEGDTDEQRTESVKTMADWLTNSETDELFRSHSLPRP